MHEENIKLLQKLLTKNASEIPISDSLSVWINFGEDDRNSLNLKEPE